MIFQENKSKFSLDSEEYPTRYALLLHIWFIHVKNIVFTDQIVPVIICRPGFGMSKNIELIFLIF